jgi:DNA-binding response OmpR family regulator
VAETIVVLEDNEHVLELLRDLLISDGFRVVGVAHPYLLEEALAGVEPDLFVIDIMLPEENGVEVARRLRARGYRDTPMIALTASKLTAITALRSGYFDETVEKPFDITVLLAEVRRRTARGREEVAGSPFEAPSTLGESTVHQRRR